jgi:lipoprotein-anchoring transpeptidase ErfK/SrfK
MKTRFKAAALFAIGVALAMTPAYAGPSGYGVWSAPEFGGGGSSRWQQQVEQAPSTTAPSTPQWRALSPQKRTTADGGPRPAIAPAAPPIVIIKGGYEPGTVVVDTQARTLYLVQEADTALAYPIGVGREGFEWSGEETISRIADWPDWYPPAEMRQRQRGLPVRMTGGLRNPLGAKALYLGSTLYRIHGTDAPKTIGTAQSSGCIRMLNEHVVDLAGRIGIGTKVVVVAATAHNFVVARVPAPSPARASSLEARLDLD